MSGNHFLRSTGSLAWEGESSASFSAEAYNPGMWSWEDCEQCCIHLEGAARNGLTGYFGPAIDYDMTICINTTSGSYEVTGEREGFPDHRATLNPEGGRPQKLVDGVQSPDGAGVLLGDGDTPISATGSI